MRVIDGDRAPIHLWSTVASEPCIRQLRAIAAQPYVVGAVAAMADAHLSASGVAVGTVFATEHSLVPDALGDDLGCGVRASRLNLCASELSARDRERILALLGRTLPAGDRSHRAPLVEPDPSLLGAALSTRALAHRWPTLLARQLATLGGGNHFVELDRDADDALWLLVHSGSRGVGGAIATHHRHAAAPRALAAIDARTSQGAAFAQDLAVASSFAEHNRRALAQVVRSVIERVCNRPVHEQDAFDVGHNRIDREEHFGRELWVHRKGAVRARAGDRAIVPGSMATATYVVEGLGCEAAWCSCSHGAGRVLSRTEARNTLRPQALIARMGRVTFDQRRANELIEEAPQVYRDVREVLDEQRELVRPTVRLEPVLSFKG